MYVKMLKEKTIVIDAINSRTFPAGWQGDVSIEILATWADDEFDVIEMPAEKIAAGGIPAGVLSAEQVGVLQTAADNALRHAQSIMSDAGKDASGDDKVQA